MQWTMFHGLPDFSLSPPQEMDLTQNRETMVQYLTTLAHINRMVMKSHSVESLVMYVFTLNIKARLPWYSVWVSFQGPHNSMGHSPWPDCKDFGPKYQRHLKNLETLNLTIDKDLNIHYPKSRNLCSCINDTTASTCEWCLCLDKRRWWHQV